MRNIINKKIGIFALIVSLILFISPNVVFADYTYDINLSSLPFTFQQELEVFSGTNSNSLIQLDYGDYIFGPNNILIQNTSKKINISIELTNTGISLLKSTLNSSSGQSIDFNFNVINDPTPDDFEVFTDKNLYETNETMYITINAHDNTHILLDIIGPMNKSYDTTISNRTVLVFIPEKVGNYSVKVSYDYQDYEISKETEFIVNNKFSCNIQTNQIIEINSSNSFSSTITGGINETYYYFWDFGDSVTSKLDTPNHEYNEVGIYDVSLILKNELGVYTTCGEKIIVGSKKYNLIIEIHDDVGKILGDALIQITDSISKKSNINGIAVFNEIEADRYRIKIERDGYETFRGTYIIQNDTNLIINLTKDETEIILPEITIISNHNDTIINNKPLIVEFDLLSVSNNTDCKMLLNEIPYLGYQVIAKKEGITQDGKVTLSGEIRNGNFNIKISCENEFGIAYSNKFRVTGKNFNQESLTDISLEKEDESTSEENSDNKQNNAINNEKNPLITKFDVAIEKINEATTKYNSYKGSIKTTADNLEFLSKLKTTEKEIRKLRNEMITLIELSIPISEFNTKRIELETKLQKSFVDVPSSLSIITEEKQRIKVTEEDIEEVINNYMNYKNTNLTKKEFEFYKAKSLENQDLLKTNITFQLININYLDGANKEYSFITKTFDKDINLTGILLFEIVPKTIAKSIDDINFLFLYELLNQESMIGIPIDNNEISYFIDKRVLFDEIINSKSVLIIDPSHPRNRITGFSILNVGTGLASSYGIIFFVLIILSASFVSVYSKPEYKQRIVKTLKKAKDNLKLRTNSNLIQDKNSNQNSNQNLNLNQRVYMEQNQKDKLIFNKNNNYNNISSSKVNIKEQSKNQLYILLDNTLDYLNSKNHQEAFRNYPKILNLYQNQNQLVQKEISPIINHLSSEIELYHFINLLNKAKKLILGGMYDSQGEMNNEIEEIYSELSDKQISKVNLNYNEFNRIRRMRDMRKTTQLRTEYANGIDDLLYATTSK